MNKIQSSSWWNVIPPHPAALLLPRMTSQAVQALGENIKARGQKIPVVIFADAQGKQWLLDGICRLDGMAKVNLKIIANGALNPEIVQFQVISDVDPVAYVLGANLHRRHLSGRGKRELAGNLLLMFQNKSDRQIAELVGISHSTVKSVRDELVRRGQIGHVETRLDAKGRLQPATKVPKVPIVPNMPATAAEFTAKPTVEPPVESAMEPDAKPDALAPMWATIERIDNFIDFARDQELTAIEVLTSASRKKISGCLRELCTALKNLRTELTKSANNGTPADIKPVHSSDPEVLLKSYERLPTEEIEARALQVRRLTGRGTHLSESQWKRLHKMEETAKARRKTETAIAVSEAA